MKLAFSTLPFIGRSAEELRQIAEQYSIDAVEVRVAEDGSFPTGYGLKISNLGSGIVLKGYEEAVMVKAKAVFEDAKRCGIPAVRIFLGNFCKRHDSPRQPLDYPGIVRSIREMAEWNLAQVWIETHNEFATGKSLRKLLDDVNHSQVKVIWDIIHPIEDGEMPVETYGLLGNDIAHVHVKDGIKNPDPEMHNYYYTKLGEGQLPIRQIVNLLQEKGYEGYFSLEWESLWKEEIRMAFATGEEAVEAFRDYMLR